MIFPEIHSTVIIRLINYWVGGNDEVLAAVLTILLIVDFMVEQSGC